MTTQIKTEEKKDVQSKSVNVLQTTYHISKGKIRIYLNGLPAGMFILQENGDVAFLAHLLGDGDNLNRFISKMARAMDGKHSATWATVINWLEKTFNNTSRIVKNEDGEMVEYEKAQIQVKWVLPELPELESTKLDHDSAKLDLINQCNGDFSKIAMVASGELQKIVTGKVAESELRDPLQILEV